MGSETSYTAMGIVCPDRAQTHRRCVVSQFVVGVSVCGSYRMGQNASHVVAGFFTACLHLIGHHSPGGESLASRIQASRLGATRRAQFVVVGMGRCGFVVDWIVALNFGGAGSTTSNSRPLRTESLLIAIRSDSCNFSMMSLGVFAGAIKPYQLVA